MTAKPTSHDAYLDTLDPEKRAALESLRATIRAAAPKAEETISYGVPAFRLNGKLLVMFGATKKHCAFYPGSGTAVDAHADHLAAYETSKGAIRFSPDVPLPVKLVKAIVKYRIKENAHA